MYPARPSPRWQISLDSTATSPQIAEENTDQRESPIRAARGWAKRPRRRRSTQAPFAVLELSSKCLGLSDRRCLSLNRLGIGRQWRQEMPGPHYDRGLLLSPAKRNQHVELWEVEKFGADSFGDPHYVSIYG